jgi:hypothetical protein
MTCTVGARQRPVWCQVHRMLGRQLVLRKYPFDLIDVARLGERQHEEHSSFLGIERVSRDHGQSVVFFAVGGVGDNAAIANAARADQHGTPTRLR